MTYEELLQEAENNNLIVKEKPLMYHEGLINDNVIAIKKDMPTVQKACALAEEISHYYENVGNIIDLSDIRSRKQEYKARLFAYDRMIGLDGLVNAYNARCQDLEEIADYLHVTEAFLLEALECYKNKYGVSVRLDNYVIQFIPNLSIGMLFGGD